MLNVVVITRVAEVSLLFIFIFILSQKPMNTFIFSGHFKTAIFLEIKMTQNELEIIFLKPAA